MRKIKKNPKVEVGRIRKSDLEDGDIVVFQLPYIIGWGKENYDLVVDKIVETASKVGLDKQKSIVLPPGCTVAVLDEAALKEVGLVKISAIQAQGV